MGSYEDLKSRIKWRCLRIQRVGQYLEGLGGERHVGEGVEENTKRNFKVCSLQRVYTGDKIKETARGWACSKYETNEKWRDLVGQLNGKGHSEIVGLYYRIILKGTGKGKVQTRVGHEGPEGEQKYSSTLSLTSTIDGVGDQLHAPATLPPGKRRGTDCIGSWVGHRAGLDGCGNCRPPPGFDPRTVQPVASRYTDCAILAHRIILKCSLTL